MKRKVIFWKWKKKKKEVIYLWWKVPVIFNEFEIKWEISCWGYFKIKKGISNTEV